MATDNNIKNYNAADIEKYHKGQLSAVDMHAMEKAAIDDPFLADAMEGYAVAGVTTAADIADLKNRLKEKTGSAKVVSLATSPRRSFQLIRAAVIIAFIAGAATLIYQLGFNNKENKQVADAKKEDTEFKTLTDSTITGGSATQPESSKANNLTEIKTGDAKKLDAPKLSAIPEKTSLEKPVEEKSVDARLIKPVDGTVSRSFEPAPQVITGPTGSGEKNKPGGEDKGSNKTSSREVADLKFKEKDKDLLKDEEDKKDQAAQSRKAAAKNQKKENLGALNNNTFRGRITDERNVGVPFANVTNLTGNNAGTYTDAQGYFNLIYPDSVLNVEVKSIGFENRNAQLRNSVPTNQVVLQDDRYSLSEVVVSNQKLNAATRKRDNNIKLEEPEPADGWEKYDAYLLNNLNMPDDARERQRSDAAVQLSFDVNKHGEPTNIKIEKSLCKDCDKEAIRLVKEGPKWKRGAKKGRTTVTVPFQ